MQDQATNDANAKVEAALVDFYNTTTVEDKGSDPVPEAAPEIVAAPEVVAAPVAPEVVTAPVTPVVEAAPVTPEIVAPQATAVDTEDGGFEITLAEDSPLSDSDLDDIFALAEKKSLDKEETMALIKNKEDFYTRGRDTVMAQANKVLKEQEAQYLADPLFSTPAARTANEAVIDSALKKFATPAFQKKYLESHLKNDVELAKFLHGVGATMQADNMRLMGNASNVPLPKQPSADDVMKARYPEHY